LGLFSGANAKIPRALHDGGRILNCRHIRSRDAAVLMARECRVDSPKTGVFDPVNFQSFFEKKIVNKVIRSYIERKTFELRAAVTRSARNKRKSSNL
jgi:hypothetical protein